MKTEWVRVDDFLPIKTDRYLVCKKYGSGRMEISICTFYADERKYFDDFLEDIITHWTYLLEMP